MEFSSIDKNWPNSLRWFLSQNLRSFKPWHFLSERSEFEFAARAFAKEDVSEGNVFVFASRQDNDDFAGIEIVNGEFTERVVYFHPVFSSGPSDRKWNIVNCTYDDVFEFVAKQVVPDMKDWALTEDAEDL